MNPSATTASRDEATGEITLTRIVKAPKEKVFKLWTECEHLKHWWGPKGFPINKCKVDLRPGGLFHYSMLAPNGTEMWGKFVYGRIVPPELLEFVVSFSDADGGTTQHPMSDTWPAEVHNVVTFADHPEGTLLTLHGGPVNASDVQRKTFYDAFSNVQQGFNGTFEQLDAYIANN